jgi:tetratricopeptide (TPR) repeat protein
MSQNHEKSEKTPFKQKLSLTILKNSKILLGLLIVIVIVVLALLIYNSVQLKSIEKYTQQIETIQDDYANYKILSEETEKEAARIELLEHLDEYIDTASRNYALQRALFIRAALFYQNKEWDMAITDYKTIAAEFSNSYLAPIALINAATAYEDSDSINEAIETYQLLITDYASDSPDTPNIYFSLGRLYEQKQDTKAALEEYNKLIDNYPDSNWTNLGRSRIIYLESK